MPVKAAPPMISGVLNGPSSCLQYDEGTTKRLVGYLTSMESCDVQDSNSTSYICVASVCQSKRSLRWSPMHWMVHPAVCDMMRGPPSYLFSISLQWKAVMCRTLTAHNICVSSVCQSKRSLRWSPVHWMVDPPICNMMRGPPSVLLDISHQWKAVMCRTLTVHHIYV